MQFIGEFMCKNLLFNELKCSDGAKVINNNDVLMCTCTVGDWPEVEVLLDGDIVGYNCVKFSLKLVKFSNLTLILHNKDGRAIVNVGELIKHREVPNDAWQEVVWNFRENPGWITPPSPNPFDFDNVLSIGFCVKGDSATKDSCFEIKNIVFCKEATMDEEIVNENRFFNEFILNHKKGTLNNKKVILWASTKATSKTRMGWTSIKSVIQMFDVYKQYKNANGLIMKIEDDNNRRPVFVDSFFNPVELDTAVIDEAIDIYKKIDWGNFTDNFFLMTICGIHAPQFRINGKQATLDWFDDDLFYNHIYPKVEYFCKALRSIGAHICFDNEAYDTEPYDYYFKYKNNGRSFAEYEEKVRQRGKEFAKVVSASYPNAKVMMLFGPWVIGQMPREEARYGLLLAFYDGLCEAKTNLTLIDACESGYEFTSYESILKGLYDSKKCYKTSKYAEIYKEKIKTDFGIWVRPDIMSKEAFSDLLLNSLTECNEFVWVYTENSPLDDDRVFDYINTACENVDKQK